MGTFSTSAATMSDGDPEPIGTPWTQWAASLANHDPIADIELLLSPVKADDPVALARVRNARRAAAQRLADAAKLIRHVSVALVRCNDGTFTVARRDLYTKGRW